MSSGEGVGLGGQATQVPGVPLTGGACASLSPPVPQCPLR